MIVPNYGRKQAWMTKYGDLVLPILLMKTVLFFSPLGHPLRCRHTYICILSKGSFPTFRRSQADAGLLVFRFELHISHPKAKPYHRIYAAAPSALQA